MVYCTVRCERRLLLVVLAQGHWPVPRGAVERRDHPGISRGVKAVLYSRKGISINLGDVVQPTIVDTESGFAGLLWYYYHWARPSTVAERNDVELQRFADLVRDDLPIERPGLVELCPYGQSVGGGNDGVLRSTNDTQGSIPHRRLRLEHVTNLLVQVLGSLTEVKVLE